jgi:hypothetical protein
VQDDLLAALTPVVDALDALGVEYRIGGSLVSSVYGVARSSVDADLVADLALSHVPSLVARLESDYYVDAEMIRDAIRMRDSFNVIHLATMMKVDVFVMDRSAHERECFARRELRRVSDVPGSRAFQLPSAEDILLLKLGWYERGGRVSERQWQDVVGVLRVQGDALDTAYLDNWADALGLRALLDQARDEARNFT